MFNKNTNGKIQAKNSRVFILIFDISGYFRYSISTLKSTPQCGKIDTDNLKKTTQED